jgi:hypothetical protein
MAAGSAVRSGIVAAASSASLKRAGNTRPRRSARRRIPAQALALKKYRGGTLAESSSTSDNEQTLAALGQSEELSVKHSPGEPIPELCQPPEEGAQRPSSVRLQNTGDVLPDEPAGANSVSQPKKLERERATRAAQSCAEPCDAEVLAGGSAAEKIDI